LPARYARMNFRCTCGRSRLVLRCRHRQALLKQQQFFTNHRTTPKEVYARTAAHAAHSWCTAHNIT
jgi:hypothetical protein